MQEIVIQNKPTFSVGVCVKIFLVRAFGPSESSCSWWIGTCQWAKLAVKFCFQEWLLLSYTSQQTDQKPSRTFLALDCVP